MSGFRYDEDRTDEAILTARQNVATANFARYRGQNRLLSLATAKLDEARGLALLAEIDAGRLAIVDRREVMKDLGIDGTVDTGGTVANART